MVGPIACDTLRAHVRTLAGENGERNVFRPQALHAAAELIASEWDDQGYAFVANWKSRSLPRHAMRTRRPD